MTATLPPDTETPENGGRPEPPTAEAMSRQSLL